MFLYSAISSPLLWTALHLLYPHPLADPFIPAPTTSLGRTLATNQLRAKTKYIFTHISTTVYSQVVGIVISKQVKHETSADINGN